MSRQGGYPPLPRVRIAASQLGLRGTISFIEGSLQEQHLQKIPDVFACSGWNGLQRGMCLGSGQPLERTEESSTGGRRDFVVSSLLLSFIANLTGSAAAEDTTTEVPLELYSDSKDGFTLMSPTPWNKVDKSGASIFFEDPESRSNNIGVTVAPVRTESLDGFGTVDDIVNKLIKAERDKGMVARVEGDEFLHMTKVLMKVKDRFELFDGQGGIVSGQLSNISRTAAEVVTAENLHELSAVCCHWRVAAAFGTLQGGRGEWSVEKCTSSLLMSSTASLAPVQHL